MNRFLVLPTMSQSAQSFIVRLSKGLTVGCLIYSKKSSGTIKDFIQSRTKLLSLYRYKDFQNAQFVAISFQKPIYSI
jgi:hypothetical protein